MKAGEKDLGRAYFKENKGFFWGLVETRPFMRAKKGYAEMSEFLGDFPEAAKHYEELLILNPDDNQGVRYLLLGVYCQLKKYDQANRLLKTYPEDSAFGTYDCLLVEFGLHGISGTMKSLLQAAKQSNPHVIPYLTGKKRMPSSVPDVYRPGDESEAVVYADARLHIWKQHQPLIRWMAVQK
jgi:tetratricopeptide (TPR) repeat protein